MKRMPLNLILYIYILSLYVWNRTDSVLLDVIDQMLFFQWNFKCLTWDCKTLYYFCLLIIYIRLYSETVHHKMGEGPEPTVLYTTQ